MSHWLDEKRNGSRDGLRPVAARDSRWLRAFDVVVATVLGLVLAVPYALARLLMPRVPAASAANEPTLVRRHALQLPAGWMGAVLGRLGAGSWPVVYDVLAGRMAWVGPTGLGSLPPTLSAQGIRPGVVTLWGVRRRTAVAYASEVECDHEYLEKRGLRHDSGLLLRACLLAPFPVHVATGESRRVKVVDVSFDNMTMQDALDRLDQALAGEATHQVSFVNPACVNIAVRDRAYRRAIGRASLVLPDGIGIKLAADILGQPLSQNVNGTDLFPRLCALMERRQSRLFLLGGQPGVPDAVAAQIRHRWPGVVIVGVENGFFSAAEEGLVVAQIKESRADVVLVARGVPVQDVFMDRYLPQFGAKVVMGVGGLFDFVAGRINRAPGWMRDSGLEWVYRLAQEPGRMWRRYLLGNFSFLARVLLQRLGWRRPADDAVVIETAGVKPACGSVRAVLFACGAVDESIPAESDLPASLMPLGCASFLERALEHLSEAGVRQVHLVACHQPEALRRVVGHGERWGLSVQWHLAKSHTNPYGVLSPLDLHGVERLVVGHAEHWIGRQAVQHLASQPAVAWVDDVDPQAWAGWASVQPSDLARWPVSEDWSALSRHLHAQDKGHAYVCAGAATARAGTAADLLAAQVALAEPDVAQAQARQLPGSWIKTPWGGMSPSARVHPHAVIRGPVLLGPGCLVDAEARVGPDVVLERDVLVARGSSVAEAVVLANTFIGEGLDVKGAVVAGRRMHQLELGVTIELPKSDALLMALNDAAPALRPTWVARSLAALGSGLLWLPAVLDRSLRQAQGLAPRARQLQVVTGDASSVDVCPARALWVVDSAAAATRWGHWLSLLGPLQDVAAGHRTWLGRRPWTAQQWAELAPEWRKILGQQPIGIVHAPAWSEDAARQAPEAVGGEAAQPASELEAAADVFLAVHTDAAWHRRVLLQQLLQGHRSYCPGPAEASVPPPAWRPDAVPKGEDPAVVPSVSHLPHSCSERALH